MGNFQAVPNGQGTVGPLGLAPEEVSLLMDGELDTERSRARVPQLRETAAMETWVCYRHRRHAARLRAAGARIWAAILGPPRRRATVLRRRGATGGLRAWAIAASAAVG